MGLPGLLPTDFQEGKAYFDSSGAGGSHVGALTFVPRFTLRCVPQTTRARFITTHTNLLRRTFVVILVPRSFSCFFFFFLFLTLHSSYRQRKKSRADSVTGASFYSTSRKFYRDALLLLAVYRPTVQRKTTTCSS